MRFGGHGRPEGAQGKSTAGMEYQVDLFAESEARNWWWPSAPSERSHQGGIVRTPARFRQDRRRQNLRFSGRGRSHSQSATTIGVKPAAVELDDVNWGQRGGCLAVTETVSFP